MVYFRISLILFLFTTLACRENVNKLDDRCFQNPKYLDEFELPEGLIGYNNYERALDCSKKTNKPLVIYFSGFACVNCRRFEDDFLFTNEIKQKLNEDFVFALLNVDDKRELPEEDQVIVRHLHFERRLKTIGNVAAHLQTVKQYGGTQPNLAIIDTNGKLVKLIHYNDKEELMKQFNEAIKKLE